MKYAPYLHTYDVAISSTQTIKLHIDNHRDTVHCIHITYVDDCDRICKNVHSSQIHFFNFNDS